MPEDIQLFELRPLPPEEASLAVARGSHIGFRVKRSGISSPVLAVTMIKFACKLEIPVSGFENHVLVDV